MLTSEESVGDPGGTAEDEIHPYPWYRGLNLDERRRALAETPPSSWNVDPGLARKRIGKWRSRPPFDDDALWRERLAGDGLSEDDFARLAGTAPADDVLEETWGRWWHEVEVACHSPGGRLPGPDLPDTPQIAELFRAVEPFFARPTARLRSEVAALARRSGLPLDPELLLPLLLMNLRERTLGVASRTLFLELNVARLLEKLDGATPEERFASYCRRLGDGEVLVALYREYPVLARQLAGRAESWIDFSLEFLRHLVEDWPWIRARFFAGEDPGPPTELDGGAGDRHRGGRAVVLVTFGDGRRLVYKPRSMAVDVRFQDLLGWLNDRGQDPPLRTITVLDRGDHGWMEFAAAAPCETPGQLRRFYRRQGAYLAILYMLEASDFHFENLVAAGEHPVMIDLESLFHPRVGGMDIHQLDLAAAHITEHSVLRIGLLPQWIWGDEEQEGIDLSGLGARAGQLTPRAVPRWESLGTDHVHLGRARLPMPAGHHRPSLAGESREVEVIAYEGDLVEGFSSTFRRLAAHREALLADGGPIAAFSDCEVRVIIRPTQTYGILLQESFHPDLLRDAIDRERHFDLLWTPVPYRPYLTAVVEAEKEDLWRGDIPLFTTRPGCRDLRTSHGRRIEDFFDDTGLALVTQRLEGMDEDDLEQQTWFLRGSVAASTIDLKTVAWPRYEPEPPRRPASHQRLLAAAMAVGDRLERRALRSRRGDDADARGVSWIGLRSEHGRRWSLAPLELDLYGGTTGILFFLAYLGAVTGEERYTLLARSALVRVRRLVERDPALVDGIGGFVGWGSLIYALSHLAVLWQEEDLLAVAEDMARGLPARLTGGEELDFLSGAAGCITALLVLDATAAIFSRPRVGQAAAVACGEMILDRMVDTGAGLGLPVEGATGPLAGFAHGAAGAALALLQLAAATGDGRFHAAALDLVRYERTLFDPRVGNWRDMRQLEHLYMAERIDDKLYLSAWCHGGPGIGLARLRGLPQLDDAEVRAEIEAALLNTCERGFGENHSLCHGDLGNLELLFEAARRLDGERWQGEVDRRAASILDSIDRYGWLCGVPLGVETPGLMTGIAGVGYGLLRLADPERVPSVLVLEEPVLVRETPAETVGRRSPQP